MLALRVRQCYQIEFEAKMAWRAFLMCTSKYLVIRDEDQQRHRTLLTAPAYDIQKFVPGRQRLLEHVDSCGGYGE